MKTNSAKPSSLCGRLGRLVKGSALLLLASTALGQPTPKSPVGTWNLVMSGPREGLAIMSFFADGSFTNHEILVPKPGHVPGPNTDQRNFGNTGRSPGGSTNDSSGGVKLPPHTDLFGGQEATGLWGYDSRGRVIGSWYEVGPVSYSTNPVVPPSTNMDITPVFGSVTNTSPLGDEFCVTTTIGQNPDTLLYTNVTACFDISAVAITNALSFVGTVVPNKRLTFVAYSPAGKVTFSGVPEVAQADLSGNWYGIERVGPLMYTEFFTLTASEFSPNAYFVDGSGPGYLIGGIAIVCPQKKMGIDFGMVSVFGADHADTLMNVRAAVGPLNLKRLSGPLHGLEGAGTLADRRLQYTITHQ